MRLAQLRQKDAFQEPVWHVLVALILVIVLQLVLDSVLIPELRYRVVCLELLILLSIGAIPLSSHMRRFLAMSLMAIVSTANILSLGIVIRLLFTNAHIDGRQLLISSVAIYVTNIVMFGLWYWELDNTKNAVDDFQFPQSLDSNSKSISSWRPTFFDYLYVSVTNATAFSPTDTMPLTHRAKALMMVQSIASLITIALVAARAVNILS